MKKQSNLSRLMGYAGSHRILTYSSWVLSALSALVALIPFWYIWRILKEVLRVYPDFGRAENLTRDGWMAVLFAILSMVIYIGALMCSHIAAFRVASRDFPYPPGNPCYKSKAFPSAQSEAASNLRKPCPIFPAKAPPYQDFSSAA